MRELTPQRCAWAEGSDLLRRYHDEEWGVPMHDDRALFELLILEGAQALSDQADTPLATISRPGVWFALGLLQLPVDSPARAV